MGASLLGQNDTVCSPRAARSIIRNLTSPCSWKWLAIPVAIGIIKGNGSRNTVLHFRDDSRNYKVYMSYVKSALPLVRSFEYALRVSDAA